MKIEDIKKEIIELAKLHEGIDEKTLDDFSSAELIEEEAEDLIIAYCEHQGYRINGFPPENNTLSEEGVDEDYTCRERWLLYLDLLALEKDDVAEIWWFYHKTFWPDWLVTKNEFLNTIKEQIQNGFYDVEI